ncbi:hypothetical protein F2Q69_00005758 [Brassica cretica]|uniref:Uncharacterized protein n=1 Tax=Brassica cretica TaxID=69181 RepID=A0A8S9P3R6_BRACR|nr:hypothetical protein F2Q69_00005758 [Brassica cretica]
MPSGFVIPLRMVALDCSGLVTPQQRVAPAPCSVSSKNGERVLLPAPAGQSVLFCVERVL